MAEALRSQQQLDKAVAVLKEYSKRKPDDSAIIKTVAELQRQAGKVDDALASVRQARSKHGGDMRYVLMEIDLLLAAERRKTPSFWPRMLRRTRPIRSRNSASCDMLWRRDEIGGRPEAAEQAVAAADAKTKPDLDLYLGEIYLRRGRPADGKRPDASQLALLEKARVEFASVLATPNRRQDMVAGNNLAWLLVRVFKRPPTRSRSLNRCGRAEYRSPLVEKATGPFLFPATSKGVKRHWLSTRASAQVRW